MIRSPLISSKITSSSLCAGRKPAPSMRAFETMSSRPRSWALGAPEPSARPRPCRPVRESSDPEDSPRPRACPSVRCRSRSWSPVGCSLSDRTRGGLDPISVVINDVIAEFSHHHYDPMIKKKSLFPIFLRTNDYQIFFLALPCFLSITFHMIHISAKLRIDKRVHG